MARILLRQRGIAVVAVEPWGFLCDGDVPTMPNWNWNLKAH
jgi:hypothetical protein